MTKARAKDGNPPEELLGELERLCGRFGLKTPALLLNWRLRTTAGRFRWYRRGGRTPFIEISGKHLDTFGMEDALKVLRHEFAHYYQWSLYKKTSHDTFFKDFCALIGGSMPRSMARKKWEGCATANFCETPFKYLYRCPGCAMTAKRRRRISSRLVCSKCNTPVSKWEVEEL